MKLLEVLGAWRKRRSTSSTPRKLSNILSSPRIRRTFVLHGGGSWFSPLSWDDLPELAIKDFVEAFNAANPKDMYAPYLQFYAGDRNTPPSCSGVKVFDETINDTFSLARGKIRPMTGSTAVFDDDGNVTFADIQLEFTVEPDPQHKDMVHRPCSITISPSGEIFVIE